MNNRILQKCLDELNKKEDVRLDYLRGMLETLIEMQPVEIKAVTLPQVTPPHITSLPDEAEMLDAVTRVRMQSMPPLQLE